MGFCKRCGEIVTGDRCKCGGSATSPIVPWKETIDPWARTYVSRDKSPTRSTPSVNTSVKADTTGTSTSPTKRFPRPLSSYSSGPSTSIGKRVTEHITATVSQSNRPPSPLKNSTVISPESGILPSLNPHTTGSLAKVYGSVLQPKDSLASHACANCGTVFPPDSTIYPDVSETSNPTRFLCRDCFTSNGGAKGVCPGCDKAVLALKSEGKFIEAAGEYWHKACFACDGCGKDISDSPMVDLLGKPSCPECFESCLKRDRTPKRHRSSTATLDSPTRNIGGISKPGSKSREGSPAIEELEQRLGIVKSRQSSPVLEELTHRLSMISSSPKFERLESLSRSPSPRRSTVTPDDSPLLNRSKHRREAKSPFSSGTGSNSPVPEPTADQIEEMKRRFMKSTPTSQPSSAVSPSPSPVLRSRQHTSRSSGSLSALLNLPIASPPGVLTPDLLSDFSDSAASSVGPDSPPRQGAEGDVSLPGAKLFDQVSGQPYTRSEFSDDADDMIIEETSSQVNTSEHTPAHRNISSSSSTPATTPSKAPDLGKSPSYLPRLRSSGSFSGPAISPSTSCAKCHKSLFSIREGGTYVTVPDETTGTPKTYHTACFTCSVCGSEFRQGAQGQATFVKGEKGPCHIECAPPVKMTVQKIPSPLPQISPGRRTHTMSKSISSLSSSPSSPSSPSTGTYVSSRYSRAPLSAPSMSKPSSSGSVPRFGSANLCPGCKKSVSQMSFGISEGERSVRGPNGTLFHSNCLVCGGKKEPAKGFIRGRDERKKGEPGCGKKLDSGAKTYGENVYCRECWLLLPTSPSSSSQGSPILVPMHTGSGSPVKVAPQLTGTTTIARQFTGLGSSDGSLLGQLTGGGLSPTRSLSPTKQFGSTRPRPKSVVGVRSSKSFDEGRGMFLVRQMTGSK